MIEASSVRNPMKLIRPGSSASDRRPSTWPTVPTPRGRPFSTGVRAADRVATGRRAEVVFLERDVDRGAVDQLEAGDGGAHERPAGQVGNGYRRGAVVRGSVLYPEESSPHAARGMSIARHRLMTARRTDPPGGRVAASLSRRWKFRGVPIVPGLRAQVDAEDRGMGVELSPHPRGALVRAGTRWVAVRTGRNDSAARSAG